MNNVTLVAFPEFPKTWEVHGWKQPGKAALLA
jgi:hypothetical protein